MGLLHAEVDLGQLDILLVPVVLVLDQLPGQVGPGPALHDVRAVRQGVLGGRAVLFASFFNELLVLRGKGGAGQKQLEVRDFPLQGHDQLVLAHGPDA